MVAGAGSMKHEATVSRKTANKKVTRLYWPSRKRSPKRLTVFVEPKTWKQHFFRCYERIPHFQIRSGATEQDDDNDDDDDYASPSRVHANSHGDSDWYGYRDSMGIPAGFLRVWNWQESWNQTPTTAPALMTRYPHKQRPTTNTLSSQCFNHLRQQYHFGNTLKDLLNNANVIDTIGFYQKYPLLL